MLMSKVHHKATQRVPAMNNCPEQSLLLRTDKMMRKAASRRCTCWIKAPPEGWGGRSRGAKTTRVTSCSVKRSAKVGSSAPTPSSCCRQAPLVVRGVQSRLAAWRWKTTVLLLPHLRPAGVMHPWRNETQQNVI